MVILTQINCLVGCRFFYMNIKKLVAGSLSAIVLVSSLLVEANQFTNIQSLANNMKPASRLITNKISATPQILANKPNIKAIEKNDLERAQNNQPYRFALPVNSVDDFTKQGRWTNVGDTAIWRLKIAGDHVKSFNIGLKNVFLPQQAKLFFYSDNYQILVGPFTHQDNKVHKELWSPIIESNNVTIEINVPQSLKHLVQFKVSSIGQGYRSIRSAEMAKSGGCNNDVVCSEADAWRDEIRSVARYTITVGSQSFLCTGTLMNNVNQDFVPYFLTAGHCEVDAATAPSIVTYWNYETSICQGTPDGQLNQFQTGTTFLAGSSPTRVDTVIGSDFAIVQLDSTPNPTFNTYWAGWDNTPVAPSSGVSIHHPSGDEKRISYENDQLVATNYASLTPNTNGTHIMVSAWDDGTTEGGSSGSGIWNAAHHLVGTLSGGGASCDTPNQADWYGRFSTHWEGNGNTNGQVKAWLDPTNTGATSVDGSDVCDAPIVTINSSPATANIGDMLNFDASATGGSGSYTYSWDVNGDFLEDVTSNTPTYSYNYLYQGNIRVTATDSAGCLGFTSAAIVVSNAGEELFLATGLIPSGWIVSSGASAGWDTENTGAFEGAFALGSLNISDNQSASIEVTKTFAGSDSFIAFAYKVSSESNFDKLNFSVDNVIQRTWSGEIDWGTTYVAVEAGTHTLKWSYDKDASVSIGQDKVWIDGVTGISFPANRAPTAVVAQTSISVNENTNVSLSASSSTDPDGDQLSFVWSQLSGPSVTLTNSNTALASFFTPSINTNTILTFSVTVSDPSGDESSAEVTVTVVDVPLPPNSGGSGSTGLFILLLALLIRRSQKC